MDVYQSLLQDLREGQRAPVFPEWLRPDPEGLVAMGGDLDVPTVLEAYSKGIFPWTGAYPIPWCSPDPRCLFYPDRFHASRSLRKLARCSDLQVQFDQDFRGVMVACALTARRNQHGTWITPNMVRVYKRLHELHIAHSVEVYQGGELVGGLYGLSLGSAFFGESMFHRVDDASKLALYGLCRALAERGFSFIDAQAETPHLRRLGAVLVRRADYLEMLSRALSCPSHHYSWAAWAESLSS